MENIQTKDHIKPRKGRGRLIWRFLKGSKALFILCMTCSALVSLGEMIVPQIIRITIDNIIGGASTENLAPVVQNMITSQRCAAGCGSWRWLYWLWRGSAPWPGIYSAFPM